MGTLICQLSDYSFFQITEMSNLYEAIRFVVETNYIRHQGFLPLGIEKEIAAIVEEEKEFFSESFFFAVRNNETKKIIGTVRICRWKMENQSSFPVKLNTNMESYVQKTHCNPDRVWHLGRLAVNVKDLSRVNVLLLKMLLINAFSVICKEEDAVIFAEADRKVFEKLRFLDVFCEQIGESEFDLGSEAIPIYNTARGLQAFLERHKSLCYV